MSYNTIFLKGITHEDFEMVVKNSIKESFFKLLTSRKEDFSLSKLSIELKQMAKTLSEEEVERHIHNTIIHQRNVDEMLVEFGLESRIKYKNVFYYFNPGETYLYFDEKSPGENSSWHHYFRMQVDTDKIHQYITEFMEQDYKILLVQELQNIIESMLNEAVRVGVNKEDVELILRVNIEEFLNSLTIEQLDNVYIAALLNNIAMLNDLIK